MPSIFAVAELESGPVPGETLLLFVEGACEPAGGSSAKLVTSIGAVLGNQHGQGVFCFGMELPDEVTIVWAGGKRSRWFFEAKVLPYRLALECWGSTLEGVHLHDTCWDAS